MLDKLFWSENCIAAGVDEVGKGCIAGPVYAGAVIIDFPKFSRLPKAQKALIRDSKTLTPKQRNDISPIIWKVSTAFSVASASVREIENLGIQGATELAMIRSIQGLSASFDIILVDGKLPIKTYQGPQKSIVDGDALCPSIAAASILAKQARDAFMREQAQIYLDYGFERHVGYGTKIHLESINRHGICPLHRRNFRPIQERMSSV